MTGAAHNHRPADADPDSWVEHIAPLRTRPYLRLMRADRPIGTWLLLLPCWFGMALGVVALGGPPPSLFSLGVDAALFAIGSIVMRGAGCVYNDLVDRDIDAQVARTALRPLPAGDVTPKAAWVFLICLCLIGLGVLLQFNRMAILTGFAALALVAAYPFMKRITWWPQLWLGLTFNWGVLVGFVALVGQVDRAMLCLYAACIFWTLGYDTIYAHQDREDDALIGVKSSARRLGPQTRPALIVFYALVIALFAGALWLCGTIAPWPYLALTPAALHFAWQVRGLDIDNGHNCLIRFKSNRDAGFLLLFALIVATVADAAA
ncbi:MAG: 4-hydroxybenzoate octaprenyltransferase [Pseudomonadota bacterium]